MNYTKGKVKYPAWGIKPASYHCRKDWHHIKNNTFWAFYPKKKWRKVANQYVRSTRFYIPNGGWYKKIFDLQWTIW